MFSRHKYNVLLLMVATCAVILWLQLYSGLSIHSTVPFNRSGPSFYALPPWYGNDDPSAYSENEIEKYCFNSKTTLVDPIPKVVHLVIPPDLPFTTYLSIKAALTAWKPHALKLHHAEDVIEDNTWFKLIKPHVQLVRHDLKTEFPQIKEDWHYAHVADILRMDIMLREGGIYLDTDIIALKPIDHLLYNERDVVLGHEGASREGLCNALILARPNSTFMQRWIDSYADFDVGEWNEHSVLKPLDFSKQFPEEVCTLAPTVFFWPLYKESHVDYMHEELTEFEAEKFKHAIETNGGSMYPNQHAYHFWHHMASNYTDKLNPYRILENDTRFNILVRKFLRDM